MISVTLAQLRRYTLARQGLLERLPLDELLPNLGPLHETNHSTPYLSKLARVLDFEWEQLAKLRYEQGFYTRLSCMRGTLHLVPRDILPTIQCIFTLREDQYDSTFQQAGITREAAQELRFHIIEAIQLHGPQSSASLKKILDPNVMVTNKGWHGQETSSIGFVLRWMWSLGLLESGIGVRDWRKKDAHFKLAEKPFMPCDEDQKEAAAADLARWYFALYGPAAYEDLRWWAGIRAVLIRAGFEAIQDELVEVSVKGIAEKLYMFAADAETLSATPDETPQSVRLLPYEDALYKAYKATRYRFYDDAGVAEDVAMSRGGEAYPTIFVDGQIVGVWSWSKKPNEPMTIEPFHQMTKTLRKRLKPEVEAVQDFIEASHIIWTS